MTVSLERPGWRVGGSDVSPAAVAVAERNRDGLGAAGVRLQVCDLLPAAPRYWDLIVANLPYLSSGEVAALRRARWPEPELALDGAADGLTPSRRLIDRARTRLRPGGALLLETAADRAGELAGYLEECGFAPVTVQPDLAGRPRGRGSARGMAVSQRSARDPSATGPGTCRRPGCRCRRWRRFRCGSRCRRARRHRPGAGHRLGSRYRHWRRFRVWLAPPARQPLPAPLPYPVQPRPPARPPVRPPVPLSHPVQPRLPARDPLQSQAPHPVRPAPPARDPHPVQPMLPVRPPARMLLPAPRPAPLRYPAQPSLPLPPRLPAPRRQRRWRCATAARMPATRG